MIAVLDFWERMNSVWSVVTVTLTQARPVETCVCAFSCGWSGLLFYRTEKEFVMLVLSRKVSERVVLRNKTTGDTIVIEACAISKTQMRIGFTASVEWVISREELLDSTDPNHPDFGRDYA